MIDINNENRAACSGCTACAERCPVNCITMKRDKMGFLYPDIDASKCVDCGLCERICSGRGEKSADVVPQIDNTYAAIGLDENIRSASSSGGVFSLLAQYVIAQNGVVFGAAFDDDFRKVRHIAVELMEHLPKIQGSKYVQSDVNFTFKETKRYLEQGRTVLFSGTPCQIAGLRAFLGKNYNTLFFVSIVCHGVPAPAVWEDYVDYLEKKYHGKVTQLSFRDKCKGWENYKFRVVFDNNREYLQSRTDDLYMRGFLHDYYLRPSCYHCRYKELNCQPDVILGDLWGAEQVCPEMNDNKGTSLVIAASLKGKILLEDIAQQIKCCPINISDAIKYNQAIVQPAVEPSGSVAFEQQFRTQATYGLLYKYCSRKLFRRILHRFKHFLSLRG